MARYAVPETDSQPERTEVCPPSEEHANLGHPRLDAHRNNELLAVLETSVPKTVTVKELTTSREAFPTC
jgi:hypothetical protein